MVRRVRREAQHDTTLTPSEKKLVDEHLLSIVNVRAGKESFFLIEVICGLLMSLV